MGYPLHKQLYQLHDYMLRIWIYGRCLLGYLRFGKLKCPIDIADYAKIDRFYYCWLKMYLYIKINRKSNSKKSID